jgi:GntR family transcriptional regulator
MVLVDGGLIHLDDSDPTPIYAQIDRAVRAAVATGRLARGAQLPTVRQLAIQLRVNANTVARVYSDLERQGLLETRRGVGTFVAAAPAVPVKERTDRQALRQFARRVLDEAASRGFSRDELSSELQLLIQEESHG